MMANALKGENAVKALGKTWKLSLPFRVAKALKRENGIDLMSGTADLSDLEAFEAVFGAMIRANHPDVSDTEIEDIITEIGMMPAGEALIPAMAAFSGRSVEDMKKAVAEAPQ